MPRKKTTAKPGLIKKGAMSKAEKLFVAEKSVTMTAEQIGKKLGRSANQVQKEIDAVQGLAPSARMTIEDELQMRPEWARLQKQFTDDEQEEFKHQYVQIMSQMKGDVMATEELQVFQVITLKILIDRTMEEQKQALDEMGEAHDEIHMRRQVDDNDPKIAYWEGVYDSAKKTNKECADRYKIYSDKQDKMLHALKSTRDQRIKVWENADKSILGLVRLLIQEDQRELLGQEAEMMKIASKKEKARLALPHTYADGTVDQPLLTPETVLYEYEDEEAQPEGEDGTA